MSAQDPATTITDAVLSFLALPQVQTVLQLAWLALILGWATAILWVARDAWRRSGSVLLAGMASVGMTVVTPALYLPAIPVWMLVRPQVHVADVEERRLTMAALRASLDTASCPTCQATTNAVWRRCPWCRTWLSAPCPRCSREVELGATVCPWCVVELGAGTLEPARGPAVRTPEASPTAPNAVPIVPDPEASPTAPIAVPIVPDPRVGIPIVPDPMPVPAAKPARSRARGGSRSARTPPAS